MVELLKQGQYVPMAVTRQVMIIWAGSEGHLDDVPTEDLLRFQDEFLAFCGKKYPDVEHTLDKELKISDKTKGELTKAVEEFKTSFK
jgi:F-type H+-transporting ATPase subunit alpha